MLEVNSPGSSSPSVSILQSGIKRHLSQVTVLTSPTVEIFSTLSNSTLGLNPQRRGLSPRRLSSLQISQIKEGSLPKPSREQSWLYLWNCWLRWSEGLSNQHSIKGQHLRSVSPPASKPLSVWTTGGLLRRRWSRDKLLWEQTALRQRPEKVFESGHTSSFFAANLESLIRQTHQSQVNTR